LRVDTIRARPDPLPSLPMGESLTLTGTKTPHYLKSNVMVIQHMSYCVRMFVFFNFYKFELRLIKNI